jgi:hypothetical protein
VVSARRDEHAPGGFFVEQSAFSHQHSAKPLLNHVASFSAGSRVKHEKLSAEC